MTYSEIQDKIVSAFWSEGLKAEIARRGYVFPPMDLMAAVYQHTAAYEERLALLQLFADHVPEAAEYAQHIISWERRKLEQIRTPAPGAVYELRISEGSPTEWDNYLCTDFDACLAIIDEYYRRYSRKEEGPQTRYSIVCRKLLGPGDDLDTEVLGCCDLLPGKVIESVWFGPPGEFEDCTGICWKCEHECLHNQETAYPNFLPDHSPVLYRLPDGTVHFGVTLEQMTVESLVYVIPLEGEMIANRDYSQFCVCHDHEHIPFPDVDAADREELPGALRDNLDAFLAFLEEEYKK